MKEIIKQLQTVTSFGYSPYKVFDDWLDLMLYALTRNEVGYMEVVNRYNNDREIGTRPIDYFANAFGLLLKVSSETNKEMLGDIYMELNVGNKHTGQFFTPGHISDLMALITEPAEGNICDPASGAGGMFISCAKRMTNRQLDCSRFYGTDIDLTCVKMTSLNMCFFNLNGYAIWGDSLTTEVWKVWETKRSYLGGDIRELDEVGVDVIRKMMEVNKDVVKESFGKGFGDFKGSDLEQLSIF